MSPKYITSLFLVWLLALAACTQEPASDPRVPPLLLAPPVVSPPPRLTATAVPATTTPTAVPAPTQLAGIDPTPPHCAHPTGWLAYTVQAGDTLSQIAARTGTTTAELAAANCLDDPGLLHVGDTLLVPQEPISLPSPTATPPPPTATPAWKLFLDPNRRVQFQYPAHWQEVPAGDQMRLEGADGFAVAELLASAWSAQDTAVAQANQPHLPFGSQASITPFWLSDGREGRLILPSDDQPAAMNQQALALFPYGDAIWQGEAVYNYLALYAQRDFIVSIANSVAIFPGRPDPTIVAFDATVQPLPGNGKQITFQWHSFGATRGALHSGTAMRFEPWWQVLPSGEMMVELQNTLYANPTATLILWNDVTGRETSASVTIPWACTHAYFFLPAPERCPAGEPRIFQAAYQPFERGFMIWLPGTNGIAPQIYVFIDDGRVQTFTDTWAPPDPELDPAIVPPAGFFQPRRGFGKIWRQQPGVRADLGWAIQEEAAYDLTWQDEAREGLPGITYLSLPDQTIIRRAESSWTWVAATSP